MTVKGADDSNSALLEASKKSADAANAANLHASSILTQYNQLLIQYEYEKQFFQDQVSALTAKVTDLELWKKGALSQMKDLREQHKILRRKCGVEDEAPFVSRSVTCPAPSLTKSESQDVGGGLDRAISVPSPEIKRTLSEPTDLAEADAGVKVLDSTQGGRPSQKAVWTISHFSMKLRGAMGRPVVSPAFKIWELDEVRLMVTPDAHDASKAPRTRREKEEFTKRVSDGPCECCLKLKVPTPQSAPLEYFLTVGGVTKGPFSFDFSGSAINNCNDFDLDWLAQVGQDSSIVVGVEVVQPSASPTPVSTPAEPAQA